LYFVAQRDKRCPSQASVENTYTIIGADGQQYGPITLDQLKSWIVEGRVTGSTNVSRSDQESWLRAEQWPELGMAQTAARVVPASTGAGDPLLERRMVSGADWFFWIAGLSVANLITAQVGFVFLFGTLGSVEWISRLAWQSGANGGAITLAAQIAIAGLLCLFGIFGRRGQCWSFFAGMAVYALDGVLLALSDSSSISGWLNIGFHIFALLGIFAGLKACNQLNAGPAPKAQ
jgi:hypothetical protein